MGQKGWSQLNQVVNAEALMGFLGDEEYEGEEDVDENGDEIIFDEAALRAIIAVISYWLCIELYKGRTVNKRFAI